jgi:hypothetical protein
MNSLEAIEVVLREEGKPLHYREITERILKQNLWTTEGKTPAATINTALAVNLQEQGSDQMIGVYKPLPSDRIKFPHEIISAEIKIEPQAPVVAFGQAVAYRLFSTKTYIVMPETIAKEDLDRLEALCILFGVGLVLFTLNPQQPDFKIRMRAQRFSPDMYFVNEFADSLHRHDKNLFNRLFQ